SQNVSPCKKMISLGQARGPVRIGSLIRFSGLVGTSREVEVIQWPHVILWRCYLPELPSAVSPRAPPSPAAPPKVLNWMSLDNSGWEFTNDLIAAAVFGATVLR